jgi:NAD(P)-dependent dehydrogenase (short-subunit alcohol dehydrogenase family)
VTGGAGGIGAATVRALAVAGAKVVVADVSGAPIDEVVAGLTADGLHAVGCTVDISDESSVAAMVAFAVDRFGGIDIVDNNAAATHLTATDLDVASMDVALWDATLATNLRGPMLVCKHTIPALIERGGGSIVIISSGLALAGDLVNVAYASSKAALLALMRHVATAYGPAGIRCNVVAPGLIATAAMQSQLPPPVQDLFAGHTSVGRLGAPAEIADAVVFLASDRSSYITGQVITVDGGFLSHTPTVRDIRQMMAAAPPA